MKNLFVLVLFLLAISCNGNIGSFNESGKKKTIKIDFNSANIENSLDDYSEISEYKYFFAIGTTGSNTYIITKNRKEPISFNEKESDPLALESLRALKWNVLYPNSNGKIVLVGRYNPNSNYFILKHWYLLPPYITFIKEKGDDLFIEKVCLSLRKQDFKKVLKNNPEVYNSKVFSVKNKESDILKNNNDENKNEDILKNELGMTFVKIKHSSFVMGSDADAVDENPPHQVEISRDLYIQTTEVTQHQWTKVMGTSPWSGKKYVFIGDDFPAVYVSWRDTQEFLKKINNMEIGKYRLPTEAEWEYTCRGGTSTTYCFDGSEELLKEYAWFDKNSYDSCERYPHQVAQKLPNGWGLYDMHGNVWEWCQDWYAFNYYKHSPTKDPIGPVKGTHKVSRGGSWLYIDEECKSANRNRFRPDYSNVNLGFRIVRELD